MSTKQLHPPAGNGHRGTGKLSVIKFIKLYVVSGWRQSNLKKEHRDCVKSGFGRGEEINVKCDTRCAGVTSPQTDCRVHTQGLLGSGV